MSEAVPQKATTENAGCCPQCGGRIRREEIQINRRVWTDESATIASCDNCNREWECCSRCNDAMGDGASGPYCRDCSHEVIDSRAGSIRRQHD